MAAPVDDLSRTEYPALLVRQLPLLGRPGAG